MKNIIALILAMVMAFGLVACGNKPAETTAPTIPAETTAPAETLETTVPAETTAPTLPAETTAPAETAETTDGSIMELPKPQLAPRELQSIEGKNGTVFTASKYWKFYDANFFLNNQKQYKDIHFFSFDYNAWREENPEVTYFLNEVWTMSISGDTLVQVDLYGYNYDLDDWGISAYVNANWLGRIIHDAEDDLNAEDNLSETLLPTYLDDDIVTLIVATMRDATTGELYYEYFGRADIGE